MDQTVSAHRMPGGQTPKLIAIVDDDQSIQDSLSDLIESAGFEAQCFGSAGAFLESELQHKAACLIIDIRMPKISGLELQAKLKEKECYVPIIFITAHDDVGMRTQAMRDGAVDFLQKPFDHQLLLKILRTTLDARDEANPRADSSGGEPFTRTGTQM